MGRNSKRSARRTTCCPTRRRRACTTSTERRDSREVWVEEEEEEECLTLTSVSLAVVARATIILTTVTPGSPSHSSSGAATPSLHSSRPALEDLTTSGESTPLRGWILTSRSSFGALVIKIRGDSLADLPTSETMVEFPANRPRSKTQP